MNDNIERERRRISKELFSRVGQNILAIKLELTDSKSINSQENLKSKFDFLSKLCDETLANLNNVITNVSPIDFNRTTFFYSVKEFFSSYKNIKSNLIIEENTNLLDNRILDSLYRIILEAFSNTVTHASAVNFNLRISLNDNSLEMLISDDGIGFDTISSYSNNPYKNYGGLQYIYELTNELNGTFSLESSKGSGTKILITIPFEITYN